MNNQNILLITIDSLRVDRTGVLGPLLKDFQGWQTFSEAFTTGPGTTPSFPALLTGTLPLSYDGLGPLSPDRPRLALTLQEVGLATGAFHSNPFLSEHYNYDVGFDEFRDYQNPLMGIATKVFPRGIEINNNYLRKLDDSLHLTDAIKKIYQLVSGKPRPYVDAEVITDDAVEWITGVNRPFFCWAHYMDVHHPCFPPSEYRKRHDVAEVTQGEVSRLYSSLIREPESLTERELERLEQLYNASVEYTVDEISRVLKNLQDIGAYDDTLVIISSDHGELFGEHDAYGKPERMYDELLHVPLIVANGPDHLDGATDDLVSLLDIPPLIYDALGLDVPEEYEGRIPGKDESREYIMAEHEVEGDVIVGARSEDWLYEGDEINNAEHRLFDLRNGFELVDRDHPDANTVRNTVITRLDELNIEAKYLQGDMETDVENRLEDLGYL